MPKVSNPAKRFIGKKKLRKGTKGAFGGKSKYNKSENNTWQITQFIVLYNIFLLYIEIEKG